MPLVITFDARKLQRYLSNAEREWPDACSAVLARIGKAIWEQSQLEVPKGKTGRLASDASIYIAPHTVTIRYSAAYARIVHFRRHVRHPTGKRLFVLRPMNKGKRLLPAELERAIQEAMNTTSDS